MPKTHNEKKLKQGLKARNWFLCAHCKKDFKKTKASGIITCSQCKKKGLKDSDAIEVAEKINLPFIDKKNPAEKNEQDKIRHEFLFNDFVDCKIMQSLSRDLLKNKKLVNLLNMHSKVLDIWHNDSHIKNRLIIDLNSKSMHEELDDTSINKLLLSLLAQIRIASIQHGIVIIQSEIRPENIERFKDKLLLRLAGTPIKFVASKPKCAGYTSIDAFFFGVFDFPLEDD
ncbi:hypothetical protein HYY72_01300 [Candidatus Woesearchaeota archaeon]|nr:hypothetical protein [Candidatus Woesearchaeota archaeon]